MGAIKSLRGFKNNMSRKMAGAWIMAGVLALAIAGCAKPPVAEKDAAQAARNTAITAQAEVYAMNAMNEAKKVWDDAEAKMQNKAYQEAQAGYVAAKAAFEKAAGEVEAGKNAIVTENKALLGSLEKSWSDLGRAASKKIKKLSADMKNGWETDSKQIQEVIKKAKENANPAEVKGALAEAKTLAEKWLGNFKK